MEITDIDTLFDDRVDRITIPIPAELRADGQQTPVRTYTGECGRANLELRFSITSECPSNRYGPLCTTECVDTGGQRFCNYLGAATCLGNFQPPTCATCITGFQGANCDVCAPNYYPEGTCTKLCVPRNDPTGHFTCNADGDIVCLPGYEGTGNDCVMCIGNFREPDCVGCDARFQGANCDMCAENYYPSGICTKFCTPRDDSLGHFTCNADGDIVCLPSYEDTSTNCVTCIGNFREPDCVSCDARFQGANCDMCAENYYPSGICTKFCTPRDDSLGHFTCNADGDIVCLPGYEDTSTNCVTCVGNRKEPDCAACDDNFQLPTCTTCTPKFTGTSCNKCAGNYREPDCIECDENFTGTNCRSCAPNYFPPGECFCTPRDDSSGHYTCDPVTGERICLQGFMDPDTLCTRPISTLRAKRTTRPEIPYSTPYIVYSIYHRALP